MQHTKKNQTKESSACVESKSVMCNVHVKHRWKIKGKVENVNYYDNENETVQQ